MGNFLQLFSYILNYIGRFSLLLDASKSLLDDLDTSIFLICFMEILCAAGAGAIQIFVSLKVHLKLAFFSHFLIEN